MLPVAPTASHRSTDPTNLGIEFSEAIFYLLPIACCRLLSRDLTSVPYWPGSASRHWPRVFHKRSERGNDRDRNHRGYEGQRDPDGHLAEDVGDDELHPDEDEHHREPTLRYTKRLVKPASMK